MNRKLLLGALIVGNLLIGGAVANAQDGHYVGFVPPAFTSPFHVAMADGAEARVAELGWTIDVQAPASEGDFAGQVTIVQQLIEKGVEAISINPINVDAMTTGVKAANEAGVPVFMHNFITPLSDPEAVVTAYVGYDQWGGAEKLGWYTCELLAQKDGTTPEEATGQVYILLGIDSIFSHRRTESYLAGLAAGCPNVEVVGQQTAEWTRERGASVATAALQQFPDIDVFYGNSDEMAIGAALAAESLGLVVNQDFYAIAIDGNAPTLDLIREGKFTATLGVDPTRMGQEVVNAMQTVLDGGEVPQILLTPSVIVDASNLDAYIAGETWSAPVAGAPELDNGLPTVSEEATEVAGPAHYVGFVPPAFTSPFHVAMADGAEARVGELGWTIDVQAPASEGDFAGQVTIVQQLIEKGVEAISINPINVDAMTTGVLAANEAGVPVFMHNFITPLSDPNAQVTAYVGYDQWGGAEKLGWYTCELLAEKYGTTPEEATGQVYILLGIDSIFSHRRTEGYLAGLEAGCPNVEVVGQQTAEWTRERGASVATAALQQFPDIDVFYGNSDEMAIGAALAAESLGLVVNQDFYAIAIDGNAPTLDLIREGKFTATLGVDPTRMGQEVVNAMQTVLDGGEVPQILLTPSVIVDASNLDAYIAGETWSAPVAGSPELDNGLPTVSE